MEKEPKQGRAKVMHRYPTSQQKQQAPTPRVQEHTIKPGRSPRVAPSEVTMETTEQRKPGIPPRVLPIEVPI